MVGDKYQATVPGTLDLAERAELAINGLGGALDPERDYEMYFWVQYRAQPPYMLHWGYDPTNEPKFAESFVMMRMMCGSDRHLDAEKGLMAGLTKRLSADDGLYYGIAGPDRPWHSVGHRGYANVAEDTANVAGNGRMLRALVAWYERDPDPEQAKRIRALVHGLNEIAIHRADYAYYPDGGYGEAYNYPRSGWQSTDEPMDEHEGGEGSSTAYQGHQIQGLSRWAAFSGDEEALELAGKLTRFSMTPRFWDDTPEPLGVAGREHGHFDSHFHARTLVLRGILEYGMVANDLRVKQFVRSAYEYARTLGIARMGWYPSPNDMACEGCSLGDMVGLGVRLSDAGIADYWDDVDQITRNQLIEGQLVRADLLGRVSEAGPVRPPGSQWWTGGPGQGFEQLTIHPGQEVAEDVIARTLGSYSGFSAPTALEGATAFGCCTGNGTQGLYYAWEGIVRHENGQAQVNMLLNRASPWLDVDSYLPYEGKAVIHNKTAERVAVRVPGWVSRSALRATLNDEDRRLRWTGNYVQFDGLAPGDRLTLEFPVVDATEAYTAFDRVWRVQQEYTLSLRGNTVVDIFPRDDTPGKYPLYLRDHLQGQKAPMRTTERYVAPKILTRW